MSLRSRLIRLAHEKPTLRDHILPLLTKKAAYKARAAIKVHEALEAVVDEMEADLRKEGFGSEEIYGRRIQDFRGQVRKLLLLELADEMSDGLVIMPIGMAVNKAAGRAMDKARRTLE